MDIQIINGPNLNLLGIREQGIYGKQNFETYFEQLQAQFAGHTLHYFQSNSEGALLDRIHAVGFQFGGIVLNAGAYTHTSVALADAISAISCPVIEVHISNTHAREAFRHHSYLSPVCKGVILGFGLDGYRMAIDHLVQTP